MTDRTARSRQKTMSLFKIQNTTTLSDDGSRVTYSNRKRNPPIDIRDFYMSPVAAVLITLVLLWLSAWGTRWLEVITNDPRPFTLFFLVPVAFGAAFFGVRGGLTCACTAIVIARVFLFPRSGNVYSFSTVSDIVEMSALAFGTFTVAVVTGRLRTVLEKLRQANVNLRDSENRRQSFNREVLLAVTGGVLDLCDDQTIREMTPSQPDLTALLCDPIDASVLRHNIIDGIKKNEIHSVRVDDICTAATEAATNAVKHGGGGRARSDRLDGTHRTAGSHRTHWGNRRNGCDRRAGPDRLDRRNGISRPDWTHRFPRAGRKHRRNRPWLHVPQYVVEYHFIRFE